MTETGITFNGEGPLMSGTWQNPKTGDSFVVRDSYLENNQYIVQTMDGRLIGYNQLQDYIKISNDTKELPKQTITPKQNNELPPEVADLINDNGENNDILPEDQILLKGMNNKSIGNLNEPRKTVVNDENPNLMIIKKALSKCSVPSFDINIKWNGEFPHKEIDLLRNIMDINLEEIISYYINNIDVEMVAHSIGEAIADEINDNLKESSKDKIEEPKKETLKKSASKKSTTKKTE